MCIRDSYNGDEFTYFVERGFTKFVLDTYFNNEYKIENDCFHQCLNNVIYSSDDIDWFELLPQEVDQFITLSVVNQFLLISLEFVLPFHQMPMMLQDF